MRKTLLVFITLIAISFVLVGCPGPNNEAGLTVEQVTVKPTVGNVPAGWYLYSDKLLPETSGARQGIIEYRDNDGIGAVIIAWGIVPFVLWGDKKADKDALISEAVRRSSTFEPLGTGTATIAGRLAGFARGRKEYDVWFTEHYKIVFVLDGTFISIYASYLWTDSQESEVWSLIYSIR